MKNLLRHSLFFLLVSAAFFITLGANATLKIRPPSMLVEQFSDCKRIYDVLERQHLIISATTLEEYQSLIGAASRLTGIPEGEVREIVDVMICIQRRIPNELYLSHSLFAWNNTRSIGMFLSILKQVHAIIASYPRKDQPIIGYNGKTCKTCETIIVHTVSGNTVLPTYLLAGILSCLGYKTIYINIISSDAVSWFGKECHVAGWREALELIREIFLRVKYFGDIKVNVYPTMERYEQHVVVEKKSAKSNSFYIGVEATAMVLKYLDPFMESIRQTNRPLIAFDIKGNEIYNEEIRSATSSPVASSYGSSSDETEVMIIEAPRRLQ